VRAVGFCGDLGGFVLFHTDLLWIITFYRFGERIDIHRLFSKKVDGLPGSNASVDRRLSLWNDLIFMRCT